MAVLSAERGSSDRALNDVQREEFLRLLPTIRRVASWAFRARSWSDRQNLIDEVIAQTFVAFCGLVASGKKDLAYATPLAMFAVRRVRAGRCIGTSDNANDVTSAYCQLRREVRILPLEKLDPVSGQWQELAVEDRRATPCELAITRLDVGAWLQQLSRPKRHLAECLATGECTAEAARRFALSPGRISQLRRELQQSWEEFQREHAGKRRDLLSKDGNTIAAKRLVRA
jgi:hypothetical protein